MVPPLLSWFYTTFSFLSHTPHSSRSTGTCLKMSSSAATISASSRTIAQVVPATQTNKMIARMIGTVDMDGAGTEHALAEVDPFILLDSAKITKNAMPPFGAHPHYGHSVVTVLLQGKVSSWDSFRPKTERHVITAPASYWVDAGSGVFHDEQSVIDNDADPTQHVRLLQLWVGVQPEDRKKAARVQYHDNLPTFECHDAVHMDKVIGKGVYHVGGGDNCKIKTPHPITVVHIQHQDNKQNSTFRIPVDPTHGGFVVHLNGKHTRYGGTEPNCENDVLVLGKSASSAETYLEIQTDDSNDDVVDEGVAEYIVCTGESQHGGETTSTTTWVKKLVANGAVIAATREEAQALVPQVEAMSTAGKAIGGSFAPFGMK